MTQTLVPTPLPEQTLRTPRVRRASSRGRPGWSASVLLIAAAVVAPVAVVLIDVANGGLPDWPRNIGDMVVTTLLLGGERIHEGALVAGRSSHAAGPGQPSAPGRMRYRGSAAA